MTDSARQPPHSLDAERAVLGAILASDYAMGRVAEGPNALSPADFYQPRHRAIWEAAVALHVDGTALDPVTVETELKRQGREQLGGGIAYLVELGDHCPTASNVEYYAGVLREMAADREFVRATEEAAAAVRSGSRGRAEAMTGTRARFDILERRLALPAPPPQTLTQEAIAMWATQLPDPLTTGIDDLDAALGGGMYPEGVYYLLGPTGTGKSGLALQIARHVARRAAVRYITAELSRKQVLARIAAQYHQRPWASLFRGGPEDTDLVIRGIEGLQLAVDDLRSRSLADVLAKERPTLLVVDYIQRAVTLDPSSDRRQSVAQVVTALTEWAVTHRCVVLAISSVGRAFHKDHDGRAAGDYITAGSESQQIEYDGAGVMALVPGEDGATRLTIEKSRFSPAGTTVGLRFLGSVGFYNPDPKASLTILQEELLEAIGDGYGTGRELAAQLSRTRGAVNQDIRVLARARLITRSGTGKAGRWALV